MQVRQKVFPYPLLNHNKSLSNFVDDDFQFLYDSIENDDELILENARFFSTSETLLKLYEEKLVKVTCIIECSDTIYRKAIELSTNGKDIILPKSDFSERVDVSIFAVATKDFKYSPIGVEDDYQNLEFEIEKYSIIAANDGFNINFIHEEDEDSLAQSIFSIVIKHDMKDEPYIVECDTGSKITITLSENNYQHYKGIYTIPTYTEVFFNMLLIPALTEGLFICQSYNKEDESRDLEDTGNKYRWFRAIVNGYKKLTGNDLKTEDFIKASPVILAQSLLGNPFTKAIDKLFEKTIEINTGDTYD